MSITQWPTFLANLLQGNPSARHVPVCSQRSTNLLRVGPDFHTEIKTRGEAAELKEQEIIYAAARDAATGKLKRLTLFDDYITSKEVKISIIMTMCRFMER